MEQTALHHSYLLTYLRLIILCRAVRDQYFNFFSSFVISVPFVHALVCFHNILIHMHTYLVYTKCAHDTKMLYSDEDVIP